MEFLDALSKKNDVLFWFGLINIISAGLFIIFSFVKPLEFAGTNAWHKPIKFALSTTILSWSVAWYSGYLTPGKDLDICNWIIVLTLAFEVIYIAWQAGKGEASHYNQSTPFHAAMFTLMALAASIATLAIGYLGLKFFSGSCSQLELHYLWAIRLGFVLFVIFSFEGFVMGAQLSHTVGNEDGTRGLPFLNWSRSVGDLRVAHFIGMHALQVLPIVAWYLLKNVQLTVATACMYGILACFILFNSLRGNSIFEF